MRLFNLLSLICLLLIITACGSGTGNNSNGNNALDFEFNESDYTGKWSFLNWSGPMYGSLDIDDAGKISRGDWTVMGESFGEYAGGSFTIIDENTGSFNGFIYSSDASTVISDGQVGLNKDIIAFASISNNPEIYVSIKTEGAYDFSDLKGTWYFAAPDGSGSFIIDETGNITGGVYEPTDSAASSITGGKFNITIKGIISGYFNTQEPDKYTIQHGQMNSGKNTIAAAYLNLSSSDRAMLAVKKEGTFTMTDLEGNFKMFQISDTGVIAYGSINIDIDGNLLNGNWMEIEPGSGIDAGIYSDGSILFHNIQGAIAESSINSSNGTALTLESGQMNSDKNAVLAKTNSGLLLLLKTP